MSKISLAMTAVAFFCASGGAFAAGPQPAIAKLTEMKGGVFVDAGQGFLPVETPVANLKLGDRVIVAKEGSAVLSYGPDCAIPLVSPSMTTVADAGCVIGTQAGVATSPSSGGAVPIMFWAAPFVVLPIGILIEDEDAISP